MDTRTGVPKEGGGAFERGVLLTEEVLDEVEAEEPVREGVEREGVGVIREREGVDILAGGWGGPKGEEEKRREGRKRGRDGWGRESEKIQILSRRTRVTFECALRARKTFVDLTLSDRVGHGSVVKV